MKVDIQMVVVTRLISILKYPLANLENSVFRSPAASRLHFCLLSQVGALIHAAAMDRLGREFLCVQPLLPRLITQQIHPKRAMLQLFPDGYDQRF